MKYQVIGRNVKVTEPIEKKILKKMKGLEKYFLIREDTECRIVVSVDKEIQAIEVTIPTSFAIIRAEVKHFDLYAAIDLVIDKLENQLQRVKNRLNRSHREHLGSVLSLDSIPELINADSEIPVKTKSISLETYDLDEAINRMELLGHDFHIYRDSDDLRVSVVYRRKSGGYGIIEVVE